MRLENFTVKRAKAVGSCENAEVKLVGTISPTFPPCTNSTSDDEEVQPPKAQLEPKVLMQPPARRTPVLGWNTWCTEVRCGVDWCSSSEILSVATAIKDTGLFAAGYDHILLDDCWGVRNATTAVARKKLHPLLLPTSF